MTAPNRQARRAAAATEAKAPPPAPAANDEAKAGGQVLAKPFMVVFQPQEGQALLELIDAAIRAQGLNAAAAGLVIADKVQKAMQAAAQSAQAS